MTCHHTSIQTPHYGALSTCISCALPIIFDGAKWHWTYALDVRKTAKLRVGWEIDQITGKHVPS